MLPWHQLRQHRRNGQRLALDRQFVHKPPPNSPVPHRNSGQAHLVGRLPRARRALVFPHAPATDLVVHHRLLHVLLIKGTRLLHVPVLRDVQAQHDPQVAQGHLDSDHRNDAVQPQKRNRLDLSPFHPRLW